MLAAMWRLDWKKLVPHLEMSFPIQGGGYLDGILSAMCRALDQSICRALIRTLTAMGASSSCGQDKISEFLFFFQIFRQFAACLRGLSVCSLEHQGTMAGQLNGLQCTP